MSAAPLQKMEVFFNFKSLCESVLEMDLARAFRIFEEQSNLAFPDLENIEEEQARVFLTSMNRSLYNYILYKRDVSMHNCCFQNSVMVHKCESRNGLFARGQSILQMYYNELNLSQKNNVYINRAKQFIEENLSEPLSLEQVASQVFVCKAYLSELFSNCTGIKFSEYVTLQRVEQAKRLLICSSQSIQEISQNCGFSSAAYFSSVFAKVTGKSPRKFRQEVLKKTA